MIKLTYPDGATVEKSYTQRWQLHETKYNSSVIETRTYDDGMRLLTCVPANGKTTTYTYREDTPNNKRDNLIESIDITGVTSFDYSYDANKNKLAEIINGGSGTMSQWSFGDTGEESVFDADDRLTEWKRKDNGRDLVWSLSLVGNWDSLATNGNPAVSRTYNHAHELVDVNTSPVAHDVKGNLLEDDAGHEYEYDFDNRLNRAEPPGSGYIKRFYYDVLGRRVKIKIGGTRSIYVHSGQQAIARYYEGGAVNAPFRKHVYGSYIDEPIMMDRKAGSNWYQYYYHRNAQYSTAALTNTSGSVVERYAYDAYGNTTVLAANGTSGRYNEGTVGIYHFRARAYHPELGQFLSRDPIGYHDGMSLYRGYFAPQGLDPWGLQEDEIPLSGGSIVRDTRPTYKEIGVSGDPFQDMADWVALANIEFQNWIRGGDRLDAEKAHRDHVEIIIKRRKIDAGEIERDPNEPVLVASVPPIVEFFTRKNAISNSSKMFTKNKDELNKMVDDFNDFMTRKSDEIPAGLSKKSVPKSSADEIRDAITAGIDDGSIKSLDDVVELIENAQKGIGKAAEEIRNIKITGWSKGKEAGHFADHAADMGITSQRAYTQAAKDLAKKTDNVIESKVGNTLFKYDKATDNILIINGRNRKIKTFYKADHGLESFKKAMQDHLKVLRNQGH